MSYNFTYNPDAIDSSIGCSKKASTIIEYVNKMIHELASTKIPKGFSAFDKLSTAINTINRNVKPISDLNAKMENIKVILENADSSQFTMIRDLEAAGMKMIPASSIGMVTGGYIFVPQDFDGTEELPMMVYIGGEGSYNQNTMFSTEWSGFPPLVANGKYAANSIIYFPAMNDGMAMEAAGAGNGLQASIEQVAKEYNADTDRISVWGISNGARAAMRLVAESPNCYATCVAAGASTHYLDALIANPNTKFIFFCGTQDDSDWSVSKLTQDINNNGGQAVFYHMINGEHEGNCMMSEEILEDVLNIRKDTKVDTSILGQHDVDISKIRGSSLVTYHGGANGSPNKADYYMRISNEKLSDEEIVQLVIDELEGNNKKNNQNVGNNKGNTSGNNTGNPTPGAVQNPYYPSGGGYSGISLSIQPQPVNSNTNIINPETEKPIPNTNQNNNAISNNTNGNVINNVVTDTPQTIVNSVQTNDGEIKQIVNNYYYGGGNSNNSSTSSSNIMPKTSNMTTDVVPEPVIGEINNEPIETPIIEPIIEPKVIEPEIVEDFGEELTIPTSNEVSEVVIPETTIIQNNTKKTNVLPIIGAAAVALGAGVGYKMYMDKKENEYKENNDFSDETIDSDVNPYIDNFYENNDDTTY